MASLRSTTLFHDANLKAYYEYSSGALTTDSSSNGITLTNNNTVAENTGKYGGGADSGTSNTNKYLSSSNNLGIDGGAVSIVGWVKLNTELVGTAQKGIFAQQNATSKVGYEIYYEYSSGSTKLQFWRTRQAVSSDGPSYGVALGTSSFHHIALTYDGTDVRGYLDGVLVAGPTGASGNGAGTPSSGISMLSDISGVAPVDAIIDDVAIFNRALTSSEIANLASATGTTTSTSSSTSTSTTTTTTSTTTTSTSTTTTSTSITTTSTSITTTSTTTSTTTTSTSTSSSSSTSTSTSTTTTSTSTTTTTTSTSTSSSSSTSTSTTAGLIFSVDHPGD
jgi:hypothetical protein